jgi:hypothetical protein
MLAAAATTLLLAIPTLAEPRPADLKGDMRGTMTCDAHGAVEVLNRQGHQVLKFDKSFDVASDAGAVLRYVDASTGQVRTLGALRSHQGAQTYAVPEGVTIGKDDHVIIYNPAKDDEMASVELTEE